MGTESDFSDNGHETEDQTDTASGFYEAKGMVRHTLIVSKEIKQRLKEVAKSYRITQGEIIEVLVGHFDSQTFGPLFEAKRAEKVDARAAEAKDSTKITKTEIVRGMKDLSPEQLAAIAAIIATKEPT